MFDISQAHVVYENVHAQDVTLALYCCLQCSHHRAGQLHIVELAAALLCALILDTCVTSYKILKHSLEGSDYDFRFPAPSDNMSRSLSKQKKLRVTGDEDQADEVGDHNYSPYMRPSRSLRTHFLRNRKQNMMMGYGVICGIELPKLEKRASGT